MEVYICDVRLVDMWLVRFGLGKLFIVLLNLKLYLLRGIYMVEVLYTYALFSYPHASILVHRPDDGLIGLKHVA
jgi:hypothetical protein